MEGIKIHLTQKEVFEKLCSIFTSEIFRKELKNPNSYLYKFLVLASTIPYIEIEYSNRDIERGHHYAWFGIIPARFYPNSVIHDLYIFHELLHKVTMKYFYKHLGEYSFFQFMKKMRENEIEASNMSEVVIYYWIPGLRKYSFGFEIWADRFLEEKVSVLENLEVPKILRGLSNKKLFENHHGFFLKALEDQRKRIVYAHIDSLNDPIERQIKAYDKNNNEFMIIWENNAEKIELDMAAFHEICENKVFGDERTRKKMAVDKLLKFLNDNMDEDLIPFPEEARAFAEVFYGFKKTHGFENLDE